MENNRDLLHGATGEHGKIIGTKIVYKFDPYEIEVEVSGSGEFLGITSIKYNKDFASQLGKQSELKYHNVEKYYID